LPWARRRRYRGSWGGGIPGNGDYRPRKASATKELIFLVEEAPEGGFTAHALGVSIFAEAETWSELQANIREGFPE